MIIFYVTDENANKTQFATVTRDGEWTGNSRAIKILLEGREWQLLGGRKFDISKDYDMLPTLISGSYMWAEKVAMVRSPNA